MFDRIKGTYREYTPKFWVLVGATFIDRVGGTLVFPFFALYVTQKFNVGMTEAGYVFGIFAVSGFFGNLIGGALADRFGRRRIVIAGLVFSALSSVAMGLTNQFSLFLPLVSIVGLLSDIAGPARAAMIADLLPEEQRAEGFGIMRVAGNLAWIAGPTLGGLLATQSYLFLFIGDAISSLITAFIVFRMIPETMPELADKEAAAQPLSQTFQGYFKVIADRPYLAFLIISMLMNLVYIQLYSTLSVYLRDVHAVPAQGYGLLMSINAGLVVVAQFWISRRTRDRPPMLMMASGSIFYMIGFTLYGFVASYPLFIVAMLIVTVGEMLVIPVSQAVVALLAPTEMRGRYMGIFALSWGLPSAVGPWAAGLILDNLNPNLVWYLGGIISLLAVIGFIGLHSQVSRRMEHSQAPEASVPTT
jgi:MFS family permease